MYVRNTGSINSESSGQCIWHIVLRSEHTLIVSHLPSRMNQVAEYRMNIEVIKSEESVASANGALPAC